MMFTHTFTCFLHKKGDHVLKIREPLQAILPQSLLPHMLLSLVSKHWTKWGTDWQARKLHTHLRKIKEKRKVGGKEKEAAQKLHSSSQDLTCFYLPVSDQRHNIAKCATTEINVPEIITLQLTLGTIRYTAEFVSFYSVQTLRSNHHLSQVKKYIPFADLHVRPH